MVKCDFGRSIPPSVSSLVSGGQPIGRISSNGSRWKPRRRTHQPGIPPPQVDRREGHSQLRPSWRNPRIGSARATLRRNDIKFLNRTSKFSPNREFSGEQQGRAPALGQV